MKQRKIKRNWKKRNVFFRAEYCLPKITTHPRQRMVCNIAGSQLLPSFFNKLFICYHWFVEEMPSHLLVSYGVESSEHFIKLYQNYSIKFNNQMLAETWNRFGQKVFKINCFLIKYTLHQHTNTPTHTHTQTLITVQMNPRIIWNVTSFHFVGAVIIYRISYSPLCCYFC